MSRASSGWSGKSKPNKGYDTGGLAYEKFAAQDEYKFVKYKFGTDIYHFAEMSWPKYKTEDTTPFKVLSSH
jgi:hypothetical protein